MSLSRRTTPAREAGFTLIEVIVAIVIISIVVAAATMAISTSSRSSTHVKLVDRQRAIASGVLARALGNRDWIVTYGCGVGNCAQDESAFISATDPLLREPEGTVKHTVVFNAVGVDLPNDGVGAGDADHQVPDVYRLTVTVTTTAPATTGVFKPYTVSGTLDMAVRARTGTLRLHSCSVTTQVDERLGLGMCSGDGAKTFPITPPMIGHLVGGVPGPAGPCRATDTTILSCLAWTRGMAAAVPGATAIDAMSIAPLSMGYTLKGPMNEPAPTSTDVAASASGVAVVPNLTPGHYLLTPKAVGTWSLWNTHSVPSGGEITIQEGEVNDAVQVFKPAPRAVVVHLEYLDTTDPANEIVRPGAWIERSVKVVPVPGGRSALASTGATRGWTKISRGATTITLQDVAPGLYEFGFLEYPGKQSVRPYTPAGAPPNYIWVPPVAGSAAVTTQVPSTLWIRDQHCDIAGRDKLMGMRITAQQTALGERKLGFLWLNPANGKTYWMGPCTDENPDHTPTQQTGTAGA
jgi:prepilin-type N-terminal cleavage/methylation domain-containing protein